MITLGIETSCDETAVCLLETESTIESSTKSRESSPNLSLLSYKILGNLINSQIELHRQYGGVFPIMAKREHAKNLVPLIEQLLQESGIQQSTLQQNADDTDNKNRTSLEKILKEKEPELLERLVASSLCTHKPAIDQIAVTKGPGLEPALWVGVNCARALSELWNIPIVAVNHMEGHIVGSLLGSLQQPSQSPQFLQPLRPISFPALALLISGGHTELVLVKKVGDYTVIGHTKDDAIGEAFDKVARMLGLPYPGGPYIHELAEKARVKELKMSAEKIKLARTISLPRPMIHSHDLDFSFSGLKTAVLYTLRDMSKRDLPDSPTDDQKEEIAREFEDAVTEVLISKTEKALEKYETLTLIIGGGVIANPHIQKAFAILAHKHSVQLYLPPKGVSGDNALMIALAGALNTGSADNPTLSNNTTLRAQGNLSL